MEKDLNVELPKAETKGYEIWKNNNNGFACMRLHYSADPLKRSKEWKKQAMFGMDQKTWNTEMELSWEVYTGAGVYSSEFNREMHVSKLPLSPNKNNPVLMRGWDFGGNHSAIIMQYVGGRIKVLKEYANMGYNTRRIAKEIVEDCNLTFGPDYRYIEVIDPSGLHEGKTSTGMACADVMRELGLTVIPGEQDPSRRIDAVMQFLISTVKGKPGIEIDPSCRMLIDGFAGGYHYPEKETKNQRRNKPEKNEYSHIHDALQYACTRVASYGSFEKSIDFKGMNLDGDKYDF